MGDDSLHNQPSPDPGGSDDVVSEEDLDTLLAEASNLAAKIAGDVGVDELDPEDVEAMNLRPTSTRDVEIEGIENIESSPLETGVDQAIADVDNKVTQIQKDVGEIAGATADSSGGFEGTRLPPVKAEPDVGGTRLPAADVGEACEVFKSEGPVDAPDSPAPPPGSVPLDDGATEEEDDLMDLAARASASPSSNEQSDSPGLPAPASDAPMTPEDERELSYTSTDDLTSPPPPTPDSLPASASPAPEPAVPDFMQEFTEFAEDEPQDTESTGNTGEIPDRSEREPGVPGATRPASAAAMRQSAAVVESQPATPAKSPARPGVLSGVVRRVGELVAPFALRAANRGLDLLDVANRPVRWLGNGAREALGWLAIATVCTAVLVFLVSLF